LERDRLVEALLNHASRSYFCGVGKILLKEFMREYRVSLEEIRKVLMEAGIQHRFYPPIEKPSTLLIYLKGMASTLIYERYAVAYPVR